MTPAQYVPHIELLLQALRINRERLANRSRIVIDTRLLYGLLRALAARMPFSQAFYLATYPDIAEAHAAGKLPDPHEHFIESGFIEGRFGAPPEVDEAFYTELYKDVARAVQRGEITSAAAHYVENGAAEGRIPNAPVQPAVDHWMVLLREVSGRL